MFTKACIYKICPWYDESLISSSKPVKPVKPVVAKQSKKKSNLKPNLKNSKAIAKYN